MSPAEYLEAHLERHHLLDRVVVDVVGDPGALVFGCSNHVFEELFALLADLL
jgi:hypothetical protein